MRSTTQLQLEQILRQTSRCQFVSLATVTDPPMRKRNNPHPDCRKVTIVTSCTINWIYQNRERRKQLALGEAATFKPKRRAWGRRIKQTPLIEYRCPDSGETYLYLEVMVEPHKVGEFYFDPTTRQRVDDAVKPFLKPREGELRDYWLGNIAEMTMARTRYTMPPAATELQTYFPKAKAARSLSGRARTAISKRQPAKGAS